MSSVTGISDPREGEWPEEHEWCHEHNLRKESCGPCHQAEIDDRNHELQMAAAFKQMVDHIWGME